MAYSYIDTNLMNGETVVWRADIHWFVFVPGATLLALCVIASVFDMGSIGAICLIIGGAMLASAALQRYATELGLTNRRLIAKHGLIMRKTVEMNLGRVESLSVDQSVMGRIFDFGTVVVNGTGTGQAAFRFIDRPLEFRRRLNEQVEMLQKPASV